jgi:hypothetical protein
VELGRPHIWHSDNFHETRSRPIEIDEHLGSDGLAFCRVLPYTLSIFVSRAASLLTCST